MAKHRAIFRVAAAASCALLGAFVPPAGPGERGAAQARSDGQTFSAPVALDLAGSQPVTRLSVLTYNVHGLPELLRKREAAPLEAISDRLQTLRSNGQQPQIVVLQEAFTPAARRIGPDAGYRYQAIGPAAGSAGSPRPDNGDQPQWWKGEGIGKHADSGLIVLSDYPILSVRRLAFPQGACAGFDCLSNKGMLLVSIKLPGHTVPIDIVTTHLNSRKSSGVSDARSIIAYRQQAEALFGFLAQHRDPRRPLVLAGDMNIGKAHARREAFFTRVVEVAPRIRLGDAVGTVAARGPGALPQDAVEARTKAKDWQFWADGTALSLSPVAIHVPFGREPDGSMLSDHIGFAAEYRLTPVAAAGS